MVIQQILRVRTSALHPALEPGESTKGQVCTSYQAQIKLQRAREKQLAGYRKHVFAWLR